MEDDGMVLNAPDRKNVKCINCRKGRFNYMAKYCLAFDEKPGDVYYGDGECPSFEPIIK